MLVAAFRPRDFGRTTEALYVDALIDLDFGEAQRAVRWGIRDGWRFLPSIAQLRAEVRDDYEAPPLATLPRPALPGVSEVPAETVERLEGVVEMIGRKRANLAERHIDYDPEQVARRKREAKAAAAKERKRLRAKGRSA